MPEKYNKNISKNSQVRFDAIINRIPTDADTVLNIGVTPREPSKQGFLHEYIIENTSAEVVGIALRQHEVQNLTARGYDVKLMDGQYIDFNRSFDCIVVGQVMRNFQDFGDFFQRVEDHLGNNGELIFSMPNPHSFAEFRKTLIGNIPNATHLSPENIIQMLDFCDVDLKLKEYEFLPGKAGGISDILWRLNITRLGSPQYVGTIKTK